MLINLISCYAICVPAMTMALGARIDEARAETSDSAVAVALGLIPLARATGLESYCYFPHG